MFLDLSRNFYGYESVIELLSIMGPLELNQLHLRNVLAIQINELEEFVEKIFNQTEIPLM